MCGTAGLEIGFDVLCFVRCSFCENLTSIQLHWVQKLRLPEVYQLKKRVNANEEYSRGLCMPRMHVNGLSSEIVQWPVWTEQAKADCDSFNTRIKNLEVVTATCNGELVLFCAWGGCQIVMAQPTRRGQKPRRVGLSRGWIACTNFPRLSKG